MFLQFIFEEVVIQHEPKIMKLAEKSELVRQASQLIGKSDATQSRVTKSERDLFVSW